jgi:ABC-type dipeptide/oligopeptide/nickel transport system permease component
VVMARYAFRRVVLMIPVLLGVTLITFVLTRVMPGNPIDRITSVYVPAARIEELKREAGLGDPVYLQYAKYVGGLLHGDLGTSFMTGLPVATELVRRFPATFELTTYGMLLTVLIGTGMGMIAAVKRDGLLDQLVRVISVTGYSMPVFWLGLILAFIFFFKLGLAPAPLGRIDPGVAAPVKITGLYTVDSLLTGDWVAFVASTRALMLPVASLVLSSLAPIARITRSEMVEALDSEYVRTARSLGLPQSRVLRYTLRNGLLPIMTMAASIYGYLLGGSVLIETIFAWPGMGQYAFNGIANNDYTVVQGYIVLVTFTYLVLYLVLDIAYSALDPRVQY